METQYNEKEQAFHSVVRENIISLLICIVLYVISYVLICVYRRRADKEDYYSADYDDALVYRFSTWVCTFALAVSLGAVLLLPMSILANESLLIFPKSYYLQWLNGSLIQGQWNLVSFCSNLCIFILLPFTYLLTESEGFPGSQKGIVSRIKETVLILFLLIITIFGMAWLISAFFESEERRRAAFFDVWNFYLPYIYSCISLFGVLLQLICTPVGVATLFTVIGDLVVRPQFMRDLEDELNAVRLEEDSLARRLNPNTSPSDNGFHDNLTQQLRALHDERLALEQSYYISPLRRNIGYPLVMILLLALTAISVFLVIQNTLLLLAGVKSLPVVTKDLILGTSSLSALGPVGAAVEIGIIIYLMLASVVGLYGLPLLGRLHPQLHNTSMPAIIGNCCVLLILSSALPVLSRTLGITDFDLLGTFRSIEWLGNWTIVLSYNLIFGVSTTLCLFTKFTATLRHELWFRFHSLLYPSAHVGRLGNNIANGSLATKPPTVTGDSEAAVAAGNGVSAKGQNLAGIEQGLSKLHIKTE